MDLTQGTTYYITSFSIARLSLFRDGHDIVHAMLAHNLLLLSRSNYIIRTPNSIDSCCKCIEETGELVVIIEVTGSHASNPSSGASFSQNGLHILRQLRGPG